MINKNFTNKCLGITKDNGFGTRIKIDFQKDDVYVIDSIKEEIRETMEEDAEITGVTFMTTNIFDNSVEVLGLLDKLKESKINIWCYTDYTLDDIIEGIESGEHIEWYEILCKLDILVDGPFVEEMRDDKLKYRRSINQRIIDIRKSLRLNDGYVYLASYFHLQDYNQTRYKFGEWCRCNVNRDERRIKDLFKYLGLRDNRNKRKDGSIINPRLTPNKELEVTNDIEILLRKLKAKGTELGCNTKNLNKVRYLHNRWCNKTVLREKLGQHNLTHELIIRPDYVITIGDIIDKMVKVTQPRKSKFPKKRTIK